MDDLRARYEAVLFDLLTALLDSWSLWDAVAGDVETGRRWRFHYLRLTYATGDYQPYERLVAEAARAENLDPRLADELTAQWDELQPYPEVAAVLTQVRKTCRIGVVTNCSEQLGARAVARVGVDFDTVVTAERAGAYKPRPEPYLLALDELGTSPEHALFVAGSRFDIAGAGDVGMDVWWHNRAHLDRGELPVPSAEHDSLHPLPADLLVD